MKSIFVGNLDLETTEGELRSLFETYGRVGYRCPNGDCSYDQYHNPEYVNLKAGFFNGSVMILGTAVDAQRREDKSPLEIALDT